MWRMRRWVGGLGSRGSIKLMVLGSPALFGVGEFGFWILLGEEVIGYGGGCWWSFVWVAGD